jgi:hypothetical protein
MRSHCISCRMVIEVFLSIAASFVLVVCLFGRSEFLLSYFHMHVYDRLFHHNRMYFNLSHCAFFPVCCSLLWCVMLHKFFLLPLFFCFRFFSPVDTLAQN